MIWSISSLTIITTLFEANIITRRDNIYKYNCFMCNTKTLEWQYSKRNSSPIIRSWFFRSYLFCHLDLLNLYRWPSSCYAHYRIPIRSSLLKMSHINDSYREGPHMVAIMFMKGTKYDYNGDLICLQSRSKRGLNMLAM